VRGGACEAYCCSEPNILTSRSNPSARNEVRSRFLKNNKKIQVHFFKQIFWRAFIFDWGGGKGPEPIFSTGNFDAGSFAVKLIDLINLGHLDKLSDLVKLCTPAGLVRQVRIRSG